MALMDCLNKEGKYKALYTNIENAWAVHGNLEARIDSILSVLADEAYLWLDDTFIMNNRKRVLEESGAFSALQHMLSLWCMNSDKPVVLFIDEVDSLMGDTLISVLRQLRSGYTQRPERFPQCIILCGLRDVKDYRIHSDIEKTVITGGSAFNIKAKSLRLGAFNPEEIKALFQQHTTETGQRFNKDIFPLVWELTRGQPWLVNALAYEVCFEIKENRNREKEITVEMIQQAKENLIIQRATHLHQLADKLKEDRVRRVIQPILAASEEMEKLPEDDVEYCVDLGLIVNKPEIKIANRIYQEVIPRQLTYTTQMLITHKTSWYTEDDGSLNMSKLLNAFQDFFRKQFEHWVQGLDYKEAGPQLLLQAFLQRIVNGGGRVEREYGFGRGRTDLYIWWPLKNDDGTKQKVQEIVLELKIRYDSLEKTIEKGLQQTRRYMDKCGTSEGYLLIFDRSPNTSWDEKIFKQQKAYDGVNIGVYGM